MGLRYGRLDYNTQGGIAGEDARSFSIQYTFDANSKSFSELFLISPHYLLDLLNLKGSYRLQKHLALRVCEYHLSGKADLDLTRFAAKIRELIGRCRGCVSKTTILHALLEVPCCSHCSQTHPVYRMIYRTTAKKEFGATDTQLWNLRSADVTNPHYKSGPPATLYLCADVLKVVDEDKNSKAA